MTDRATIIEQAIASWRPAYGDLIACVNAKLVDAGLAQLNCCERRDVIINHGSVCTVERK